jgi:hypothetical protein
MYHDLKPVFYGAFALTALWFIVKKLDFSLTRLVKVVMKEFPQIAEPSWTRGALNAMGLIFLSIFLFLYFVLDRVRHLIELMHNMGGDSHSSVPYEFTLSIFLLGLFAFLSARSVPPSSL